MYTYLNFFFLSLIPKCPQPVKHHPTESQLEWKKQVNLINYKLSKYLTCKLHKNIWPCQDTTRIPPRILEKAWLVRGDENLNFISLSEIIRIIRMLSTFQHFAETIRLLSPPLFFVLVALHLFYACTITLVTFQKEKKIDSSALHV